MREKTYIVQFCRVDGQPDEDRLLMAKNKWLLAHPDGRQDKDAFLGLIGENISL